MDIILTKDQENAIKKTTSWFNNQKHQIFKICGYAGCGKTSIIPYIVDDIKLQLSDVAFMCFTAKAALNLRKKNIPANTIHSTIYQRVSIVDEDKKEVKIEWRLLQSLPYRLIVIDEISMVSDALMDDVLSFNIPIITIGDPAQLPPVNGYCGFLENPDVLLSEIHRQGKENPIIELSMKIRNNNHNLKTNKYSNVLITDKDVSDKMFLKSDIVISGQHKIRKSINKIYREMLYGKEVSENNTILENEKVICRMNNKNILLNYDNMDIQISNGMIGNIINLSDINNKKNIKKKLVYDEFGKLLETKDIFKINFKPDFISNDNIKMYEKIKCCLNTLKYDEHQFVNTEPKEKINYFNYGYCITCHSAQGSEWDYVIVYDDFRWKADLHKKWLYTAVTRAKNKLVIKI